MVDQNLSELLTRYGMDDKTAFQIQNNIDGVDLTNLVNSLGLPDRHEAISQANKILRRYDVSIKEATMNHSRLKKMFNSSQNPVIEKNESIEYMTPMEESDRIEDRLLTLEGFNYFTNLEPRLSDQLMDWLEANKIEFLTNGEGHFHIKCEDRDHAYKVGRTISGIMRRQRLVRDSNNGRGHDDMVERNDFTKRANKAKDKLATMTPRDPNALAARMMQAKSGGPMDPQRKIDQKDKFNRNAKHKNNRAYDEEIEVKESVMVDGVEAVVTIPKGPHGTVGVIMDGKTRMVDRSEITRLSEGVMGFTKLNPLLRLRELAGLPPSAERNLDDQLPMSQDGVDDTLDDLSPNDDTITISPLDAPDAEMVDIPSDNDMSLPSNIDIVTNGSNPSDAMNMISDHLNNIQLQLPDIKMSEYKILCNKLQCLTDQLQAMGKDYLGEHRKLKERMNNNRR